jgi:hypothetical protein
MDDGGSIPSRGRDFSSLSHRLQTGCPPHSDSYTICIGGSLHGLKLQGCEADHSHVVPRLRMRGARSSLPHTSSLHGVCLSRGYVFMAWYLVKDSNNFTLLYHKS